MAVPALNLSKQVERCNYFLNAVVEVARREPRETPDGRLMSFLLNNPTCDGGQWDMVVNLVEKYGVMPKKCFPETYSSENSLRMNRLLKSKVCTSVDFNKAQYPVITVLDGLGGRLPELDYILSCRFCFDIWQNLA